MCRTLSPLSRPCLFAFGAVISLAALSVAGLRVLAFEAQEKSTLGNRPAAAANDKSVIPTSRTLKGVVVDFDDNPVSDAIVVVGFINTGTANHRIFRTDSDGRFAWPIAIDGRAIRLYAHKPGLGLGFQIYWADPRNTRENIELKLAKATAEPFAAMLVDGEARQSSEPHLGWMPPLNQETKLANGGSRWGGTLLAYYQREVLGGSPLEPLLVATTDQHGAFAFRAFGPDSWLRLAVATPDGRQMRIKPGTRAAGDIAEKMDLQGFVSAATGKETAADRVSSSTGSGAGRDQVAWRERVRTQGLIPVQSGSARHGTLLFQFRWGDANRCRWSVHIRWP